MTAPRIVLILSTLAGAGSLLGSGVSTLAAARLMPLRARVAPLPAVRAPEAGAREVTASIQGLLDPSPQPSRPADPPPAADTCAEGLELVGLFVDRDHPSRSVAALRTAAGARAVRLGGTTEGWLLTTVARRSVTLEQRGARCELRYGRRAALPPEGERARPSAPPGDSRIQEVEPGRFLVERSLAQELSANPPSIRAVPAFEGGQMRGVRLFGIRRSSIAGQLGLQNGDTLSSIDGEPIVDAGGALEAYARLLQGTPVRIGLTRRGAPVTRVVQVGP